MKNNWFLGICLWVCLSLARSVWPADPQVVGGVDVAKWRGFNLLEKFTVARNAPFVEEDFQWMAELGFNFARLPMDYRCYTEKEDWRKFNEPALKQIDQAIEMGRRHRVHVCLNLHRAPGFCINPPEEPANLWTDERALEAFVAHWAMFAKRYKGIPAQELSFNLLNEPARASREQYLKVFRRAVEAIHREDPARLIIVDGMNVGRDPITEFVALPNLAQATRGYHPGTISHYQANWVKGSDKWPEPMWPQVRPTGHLYGPAKPEFQSPLVLRGGFPAGAEITLKLHQLSVKAVVAGVVDGKLALEKTYDPKAAPAEWQPDKTSQKYPYWQPASGLRFQLKLTVPAREVRLENRDGDWLKFSELGLEFPGGKARAWATDLSWGRRQEEWQVTDDGRLLPPPGVAGDQTLKDYLKPWREISRQGEAVFVGEWGCYNKTPHPVALAWMKNWLELWREERFGWALWNFRGSFGILDSGRADVQYEDWRGHKLDRQMLKLLQQYLAH